MRAFLPGSLLIALIGLVGCSSGPVPEVAEAYGITRHRENQSDARAPPFMGDVTQGSRSFLFLS